MLLPGPEAQQLAIYIGLLHLHCRDSGAGSQNDTILSARGCTGQFCSYSVFQMKGDIDNM